MASSPGASARWRLARAAARPSARRTASSWRAWAKPRFGGTICRTEPDRSALHWRRRQCRAERSGSVRQIVPPNRGFAQARHELAVRRALGLAAARAKRHRALAPGDDAIASLAAPLDAFGQAELGLARADQFQ